MKILSEETMHRIGLYSGVSQGSLREIFQTGRFEVQKIFEKYSFKEACRVLGRAYISQYKTQCCNPNPEFTDERIHETFQKLNLLKAKYGIKR